MGWNRFFNIFSGDPSRGGLNATIAPVFRALSQSILYPLLYQVPAILLAIIVQRIFPNPAWSALIFLPGIFLHEFCHLAVGLFLNGKPIKMDIFPERVDKTHWRMGYVSFGNATWYNAVFIGMAPVAILVLAMSFSPEFTGWHPSAHDLTYWVFATPIISAWVPSRTDFILALRSWPLFLLGTVIVWVLYFFR